MSTILEFFTLKKKTPLTLGNKFWKATKYTQFLCPFCKKERRIPIHPHFGKPIHIAQIFLTTVVLTVLFWSFFKWKTILIFFLIWFFYEIIYRMRIRSYMECPSCGFDPIIFLTNKEKNIADIQSKAKQNQPPTIL